MRTPPVRRRPALVAVAVAVLVLTWIAPTAANAEKSDRDLQQEKADVLAKKAKAAAKIDALKADSGELDRALATLQENVAAQRKSHTAAKDAAERARLAAEATRQAETAAQDRLRAAQADVRAAAVDAYTEGGRRSPALAGDDIVAIARAGAYGAVVTGRRTDALDQLDAARKDLERLSRSRAAAQSAAEARLRDAKQRLGMLTSSLDEERQLAEAVDSRLEAELAEADSLAAIDKGLSDEINRRQAALAARAAKSNPRPRPGGPVTIVGSGNIVSVRGIQVDKSIADNLARMLTAADAAGLTFGGGGYRSSEQQVALRRAHCRGDPYTAPASSCSPPTARPGQSMHERGLAIDFTCNGALIRSRSSPCFTWLKANAAGYGFYNLPSEPWHWSVNGN